LPRTRSLARAGEGAQPLPPTAPRVAERRGQRAPDPLLKRALFRETSGGEDGPGRPFASVIAATPRALNPMFHQPRRTRASRGKSETALLPEERNLGWAIRELSLSLESDLLQNFFCRRISTSGSEALPSLESKPSKDSRSLADAALAPLSFLSTLFGRGGVAVRERAALLVAGQVKTRVRRHPDRQSPFAHPAHPRLRDEIAESQERERPREGCALPSTRSAIHRTARSGADRPARSHPSRGNSPAPDSIIEYPALD